MQTVVVEQLKVNNGFDIFKILYFAKDYNDAKEFYTNFIINLFNFINNFSKSKVFDKFYSSIEYKNKLLDFNSYDDELKENIPFEYYKYLVYLDKHDVLTLINNVTINYNDLTKIHFCDFLYEKGIYIYKDIL